MEQLIIRNRFWVIVMIIVICVAGVLIPLSATFRLWAQYDALRNEENVILITREESVNYSVYAQLDQETEPVTQIFEILAKACEENDIILKQILPAKSTVQEKIFVRTQQVTLQGEMAGILKSLNEVYRKTSHVKISCIKFETEQQGKVDVLLGQIYFQNVSASGL